MVANEMINIYSLLLWEKEKKNPEKQVYMHQSDVN